MSLIALVIALCIGFVVVFFGMLGLALCVVAGRADRFDDEFAQPPFDREAM